MAGDAVGPRETANPLGRPMPSPARCLAPLLVLPIVLAACAGAAVPASSPSPSTSVDARRADDETPPRLVSSGSLAISRTVRTTAGAGPATQPTPFTITITVDAAGRADLASLVIGGVSGDEEREVREGVLQWLQAARFEPARRAGVAVSGTFRRRFGR